MLKHYKGKKEFYSYNKNNVTIDNKATPLIFKILTIEFKIA